MATSDSYLRLMEVASCLPTPVNSPAELARYLTFNGVKVSEQMMTNWKARGVSRDKSIDVAAILHTTADYILYGKRPVASPTPYLQAVRDPILDDLTVLSQHEAERWRIRIKAAADERRLDLRAAQEAGRQQEEDRRVGIQPRDPDLERRRASR